MYKMIEVVSVRKIDRMDPWERITHLGLMINGSVEVKTQEEAIDLIEGGYELWVDVNQQRVNCKVQRSSQFGKKYIITEADGYQGNNLLSLRPC